jgi:hypothetical protein
MRWGDPPRSRPEGVTHVALAEVVVTDRKAVLTDGDGIGEDRRKPVPMGEDVRGNR